jgi:CHASE2 domain-containing sensor protein
MKNGILREKKETLFDVVFDEIIQQEDRALQELFAKIKNASTLTAIMIAAFELARS